MAYNQALQGTANAMHLCAGRYAPIFAQRCIALSALERGVMFKGHKMKNCFKYLVVFFSFIPLAWSSESLNEEQQRQLEEGLGAVFLVADKEKAFEFGYGFPNLKTSEKYESVYASHIKHLNVNLRVQFFWSLATNLNFGSSYAEHFAYLIHQDCGDEFIEAVDRYIQKVEDIKTNTHIKGSSEYKNLLMYRGVLIIFKRNAEESNQT